jgi:protein O-mannosyl-transferase
VDGGAADQAVERAWYRSLAGGFAVLLLAACGWGTYQRNAVWHDDMTLWKDVVRKSPGNPRGHLSYGSAFLSRGDFTAANVHL